MKSKLTQNEYESLVEELMKDRPDQGLVRHLMLKLGIPYTEDQIAQMGLVLQSLSQAPTTSKDSVPV